MAMMPARRQAPNRAIQERIKRFVLDEGYRPGDPLPPEAELARALGVSRPALREAIKALQPLGIIETRHGTGTFVGRFSMESLVHGLAFSISIDLGENMRTVGELLELRETLETAFVARVATMRTEAQLAELGDLVTAMECRAERGEIFPEEDRAFHEALYRPLDNVLLVKLLQAFWDTYYLVRDQFSGMTDSLAITASDHRQILNALDARDVDAAVAAMAVHFHGIRSRLGGSGDDAGSGGA
jgi:DNA-binding FadR family transcriptional regulator